MMNCENNKDLRGGSRELARTVRDRIHEIEGRIEDVEEKIKRVSEREAKLARLLTRALSALRKDDAGDWQLRNDIERALNQRKGDAEGG